MTTVNDHRLQNWFALGALLLFSVCPSLRASLVISLYNDNQLYVGSDSLVSNEAGTTKSNSRKIFQIADNCCVSITGAFGTELSIAKTGKVIYQISFPNELEQICSNSWLTAEPLSGKIQKVIAEFGRKYAGYAKANQLAGRSYQDIEGTRLCFWGHDDLTRAFFCASCLFPETNHATLETLFERGVKNVGSGVTLQGEQTFLKRLIGGNDEALATLGSAEFTKVLKNIAAETPVPEKDVVNCMLEMFRLHKKYAAHFSTDKGSIDEPYIIYKITREKMVQVHPASAK